MTATQNTLTRRGTLGLGLGSGLAALGAGLIPGLAAPALVAPKTWTQEAVATYLRDTLTQISALHAPARLDASRVELSWQEGQCHISVCVCLTWSPGVRQRVLRGQGAEASAALADVMAQVHVVFTSLLQSDARTRGVMV